MFKTASSTLQRLIGLIDRFNDRFTAYRLVLYFLIVLLGWSVLGSLTGQIVIPWDRIILSAAILSAVCWAVNSVLARFTNVPANRESYLISALILTLILNPAGSLNDCLILAAAAAVAMASKYLLVVRRAHIFNPAALGAFISGAAFHHYAAWWIGTGFTTPLLILGGLLILRKIKRFGIFFVFCAVYTLYLIWGMPAGSSTDAIQHLIWLSITSTPLLFFGIIMLTEPLSSPSSHNAALAYGLLVGILYSFNRLRLSPEEALLIGNLASFALVPNRRYKLSFIRRVREADGIVSYVFSAPPKFSFRAGQYMEWTLDQYQSDSRGNRRYLTIASSPTEKQLMFTVKMPPKPSAFKTRLETLKAGDHILASYLSGNFVLPPDTSKKLAFVAGGVGITPFRSMVKYLADHEEKRDVRLLYSANQPDELAFRDLFAGAEQFGVRSLLTTDLIDKQLIAGKLHDYSERVFYISGPQGFVAHVRLALTELGVAPANIHTDFFPGYN